MAVSWRDPENRRPPDHDRRMRAAEARAAWELGSRSWAGIILAAYWNPDEDQAALREARGEPERKSP